MSTDDEMAALLDHIFSAEHMRIHGASGAWLAMASLSASSDDWLSSAASDTAAEPGVGLIELAERMEGSAATAQEIAVLAGRIAGQLSAAAEASAQATEKAINLLFAYHAVTEEQPAQDVGMAAVTFYERQREAKRELIAEAETVLARLGTSISQVTGGEVTGGGGGGGGAGGGGGVGTAAGGAGGAAGSAGAGASGAGSASYAAANGSQVGAGTYPHAAVQGPERGDFAGWVQSPNTGFLVDPATGREFDPVTGRWIDPVTGRPFGEVTEYAARLSGLGTGPGTVVSGAGLAAVGGGAATAGLAGLYGGTVPPSVGNAGPARPQMAQQAMRNLGQRAAVANSFAMREAATGGRPYSPPPGASAGGQQGGARAGRPGRPGAAGTALREPTATWRSGTGAAAAGRLGGHQPAPAPGAGAAGRPAGAAGGAARTGAGPLREPAATWRSPGSGEAARRLAPPAAPGNRALPREEPKNTGKPTRLTEDPTVWAPSGTATQGVLGD
ncbi:hypothetical protein ACFVUW_17085 [Streptomyces xiamenensis]|uniref:hypothetical protein n=1 Tax=Streptomyces xiamenensis TaxID=408015 RepID=UPI0036E601F5